jgi:lariat debranching enzyme
MAAAPPGGPTLTFAIEGCLHGELDRVYETIAYIERAQGLRVDVLLCCGDFQAVRDPADLESLACPPKYRALNSFYRYFSGEKVAPVLTLFVGGNHEASNHLQELPHGGWVAPNMYFLGRAGVVDVNGVRVGGLGGIYNERHYRRGVFEAPPYGADTLRSVYHTRALDAFRLCQLRPAAVGGGALGAAAGRHADDPSGRQIGLFLSHDWPKGVARHGDTPALLRRKRFLADEVADDSLGSPAGACVLAHLRPAHWFAAHLHTKFAAVVRHEAGGVAAAEEGLPPPSGTTKFLALDKCLPGRDFLQVGRRRQI